MALNLAERQCDCGCGKTFVPKRERQRFFNAQCRGRWHEKHKQCPHCGQWLDEPVGGEGCHVCPFLKSLASKRGKKLPDASGRCVRPGGYCNEEVLVRVIPEV